LTGPAQLQDH